MPSSAYLSPILSGADSSSASDPKDYDTAQAIEVPTGGESSRLMGLRATSGGRSPSTSSQVSSELIEEDDDDDQIMTGGGGQIVKARNSRGLVDEASSSRLTSRGGSMSSAGSIAQQYLLHNNHLNNNNNNQSKSNTILGQQQHLYNYHSKKFKQILQSIPLPLIATSIIIIFILCLLLSECKSFQLAPVAAASASSREEPAPMGQSSSLVMDQATDPLASASGSDEDSDGERRSVQPEASVAQPTQSPIFVHRALPIKLLHLQRAALAAAAGSAGANAGPEVEGSSSAARLDMRRVADLVHRLQNPPKHLRQATKRHSGGDFLSAAASLFGGGSSGSDEQQAATEQVASENLGSVSFGWGAATETPTQISERPTNVEIRDQPEVRATFADGSELQTPEELVQPSNLRSSPLELDYNDPHYYKENNHHNNNNINIKQHNALAPSHRHQRYQQQYHTNSNRLRNNNHHNTHNNNNEEQHAIRSSTNHHHNQQQQPPDQDLINDRKFDVAQIQCNHTDEGFERFGCPTPDSEGRYLCIEDRLFCDGYKNCPNGEDEDGVSCMYYKLLPSS